MEQDFQVCRNCRTSVASSNLLLHEAHCLRFLTPCSEYKEPVPKEEMKEYSKLEHRQVDHEASQQSRCKHSLESHKTMECREHSIERQLCELTERLRKLETRERRYNNRTEQFPERGLGRVLQGQIQHRDKHSEHGQSLLEKGKRIPDPERKAYHHSHNQMVSRNKNFHPMDKGYTKESVKYFPVENSRTPSSLSNQMVEKDAYPKKKYDDKLYLPSENSTNRESKGTSKTMDLSWKLRYKPRFTLPGDEGIYDILKRCSQCGILLPLPTLNQHQRKCQWLASSKGMSSEKFQLDWKIKGDGLHKSHR